MQDKIGKVKTLRSKYAPLNIEVDGGVAPSNVGAVAAAGANILVAGSAIFGSPTPGEVIAQLRAEVDKAAGSA